MTTTDENDAEQTKRSMPQSPSSTELDTSNTNFDADANSVLHPKKKEWKLENSSLWWLSHDVFQHPGNVLLMASIPFCAGAYFGYTKPMENMEKLIGSTNPTAAAGASSPSTGNSTNTLERQFGNEAERRAMGFRTAARALRVATFSSVGTFGMIGAIGFYAFGHSSVDEAMASTRNWASNLFESFERNWLGVETSQSSRNHPDVIATRHMSEEDEWDYVYEKYIKEPGDDTAAATTNNEPNATNSTEQ